MVNDLNKLVSEIIQELDYDLWKEVYLAENDEAIDLVDTVKELIEDWYNTTVEKEYG